MTDSIRTFFSGLDDSIAAYILAGIIAAAFMAGLLLSLFTGGVRKFKKAAKQFIQLSCQRAVALDNLLKRKSGQRKKNGCPVTRPQDPPPNLPKKAAVALRLCRAAGEKTGDLFYDIAVRLPYRTGTASKFFPIVLAASGFSALLSLAFLNDFAAAVVSSVGAVFSFSALLFSIFYYKSALRTCQKYVLKSGALISEEKKSSAPDTEEDEEEPYIFADEEEGEGEAGGKAYAVELEEADAF